MRTAVTNESGQYTIVNLPPGVYSVSFTVPGFSTTKRDGIEMVANFTAQVNGELKVGGVTETVEVTAETPLVDVQSAAVARAVTKDIIKEIPTGGTMAERGADRRRSSKADSLNSACDGISSEASTRNIPLLAEEGCPSESTDR